jgi:truncated hemoglobin YjbI
MYPKNLAELKCLAGMSALGGDAGLRRLVDVFYSSIFEDPVLQPVFGSPVATHVDHLTSFLGEVFGGPYRGLRARRRSTPTRGPTPSCIRSARCPSGTGEGLAI